MALPLWYTSPWAGRALGKRSADDAKAADRAECLQHWLAIERSLLVSYAPGPTVSCLVPGFSHGMERREVEAKTEEGATPYSSSSSHAPDAQKEPLTEAAVEAMSD